MNTRPIELSVVRLRNTSPQAQWKKFGILPRILPCVPLPAPGAPNNRMVRYLLMSTRLGSMCFRRPAFWLIAGQRGLRSVLVFDLHFLQFEERDHHFLGSVALLNRQVDLVRRNAADALRHVSTARGFHREHHILVRL